MRPTLRLHIGLPKAGSTSLQSAVAATSDVLFLGKVPGKRFLNPQIRTFTREIAPHSVVGVHDAGQYGTAFADALAQSGSGAMLLSDEILSSIGFASRGRAVRPAQIVENFRHLLDTRIEVFLVVREQLSFLRVDYAHLVFSGVELGYSEFLAFLLLRRSEGVGRVLDLPNLVEPLRHVADNLTVVPFELLFSDPDVSLRFLKALGAEDVHEAFLSTHQNRGPPPELIGPRLAHNRLHGSAARSGWSFRVEESEFAGHGDAASHLLRRHLARLLDGRSGQGDASSGAPADPFAAEPELMAALFDRVASSNSVLQRREPAYDWASLGYRMPQPEGTAF